ncbi:hypothetical protein BGX34_011960 [Mortierella sp. NVP85]|nr:hypothetical protein BGX34_011960 [Mortierella sp. NVP85]
MTLAPILEGLERKHSSTVFVKVDVDQAQDCAKHYSVTAMPTIVFFKNRSEVGRVIGADVNKIQSLIKTHEGGSSFSGTGQTLGGESSNTRTTSNRKRGVDDAPYHVKLWTAFSHLTSGIFSLCTGLLKGVMGLATSAKTGLIGPGAPSKQVETVEGPGGSCQIQVRMLDGSSIRGDFAPEHTLQMVRDFVQANMEARGVRSPGFSLMTSFPKT